MSTDNLRTKLEALVFRWSVEQLQETETNRARGLWVDGTEDEGDLDVWDIGVDETATDLMTNNLKPYKPMANDLLNREGLGPLTSDQFDQFSRSLLVALNGVYREEQQRRYGEYQRQHGQAAPSSSSTPTPSSTLPTMSLTASLERYFKETRSRRPETERQIRRTIQRLCDATGEEGLTWDSSVSSITKAQCVTFKAHLLDIDKVGLSTVTHNFAYLNGWLRFCKKQGWVSEVVTDGLRPDESARQDKALKKDAWSKDEMEQLVTALLKHLSHPEANAEVVWVCIVTLYTGCRAGEIWQLTCDHVRNQDGVDYLAILFRDPATGKKRIKNQVSQRKVALHGDLEKHGFLKFVAQQRRRYGPASRVFPSIKSTSPVSVFFRRVTERIGLRDPSLTLHSSRHFWETALVEAGVQMELRHRITGHALPQSEGNKAYLHMNPTGQDLKDAMERGWKSKVKREDDL